MRTIKFRGKRLDNGEWVYGYGVVFGEHYGEGNDEERQASIFIEYDEVSKLNFQFVEVDPKTVGQYTGLKDKNGKMIYEGDIVKGVFWRDGEKITVSIGEVRHGFGHWEVIIYPSHYYMPRLSQMHSGNKDCVEIIGNIYQDSHLLENESKELLK